MPGILYGVGVGPGDPELMTMKAVRIIKEQPVVILPGEIPEETIAYKIAVQAVPELAEKELFSVPMPMVMNRQKIEENHRRAAEQIEQILDKGKNAVFLTLGDPTIYSTFTYVQELVKKDGYETVIVSGVPSFCAAAAELNTSLTKWNEVLHIIPGVHRLEELPMQQGNYVLMKSGSRMAAVKEMLHRSGLSVSMVENCGMDRQKIYHSLEEIPEDAGYFSLIVAKTKA